MLTVISLKFWFNLNRFFPLASFSTCKPLLKLLFLIVSYIFYFLFILDNLFINLLNFLVDILHILFHLPHDLHFDVNFGIPLVAFTLIEIEMVHFLFMRLLFLIVAKSIIDYFGHLDFIKDGVILTLIIHHPFGESEGFPDGISHFSLALEELQDLGAAQHELHLAHEVLSEHFELQGESLNCLHVQVHQLVQELPSQVLVMEQLLQLRQFA